MKTTEEKLALADAKNQKLQRENKTLRKKAQVWHQIALIQAAVAKLMFTLEGDEGHHGI